MDFKFLELRTMKGENAKVRSYFTEGNMEEIKTVKICEKLG